MKTLIIKYFTDVSDMSDDVISAYKVLMKHQLNQTLETQDSEPVQPLVRIKDIEFELLIENEETEKEKIHKLLQRVRSEFQVNDAPQSDQKDSEA